MSITTSGYYLWSTGGMACLAGVYGDGLTFYLASCSTFLGMLAKRLFIAEYYRIFMEAADAKYSYLLRQFLI